jgi:hypothetical protein
VMKISQGGDGIMADSHLEIDRDFCRLQAGVWREAFMGMRFKGSKRVGMYKTFGIPRTRLLVVTPPNLPPPSRSDVPTCPSTSQERTAPFSEELSSVSRTSIITF